MINKMWKMTVCLIAALSTHAALALPFHQITNIYFFGDSLTDSGFNDLWPTIANPPTLPPLPPGKAPTFTTFGGYIWSQYVAHDIKGFVLPIYPGPNPADLITNNSCCVVPGFSSGTLNGINFAAGGSTTNGPGLSETWAPSLHSQVQTFLSTPNLSIGPNDVFFIWEGANDILSVLLVTTDTAALLKAAHTAAVNIASEVANLSRKGARKFVIISLPNLGHAPLVSLLGMPQVVKQIKDLSFTFDGMLNQELGKVIDRRNIKVLYVDVYSLLDNVIDAANAGQPFVVQGHSFLFTNTTDPVCGFTTPAIYCTTGSNGFLFADLLHPTDMAHRLISLEVESEILKWDV